MAENKTQSTETDVRSYLAAVEPARRREDACVLLDLMERITGAPAVLWGHGLIGFGRYHYRYDSGREGAFFRTGFAPRKARMVV